MTLNIELPADLQAQIDAFDADVMWRPVVDGFIDLTEAEAKQYKMLGVKIARHLGAGITDRRVQHIMWDHLKGCFQGDWDKEIPDRAIEADLTTKERLMKMTAKLVDHLRQFTPEIIVAGRVAVEAFDAAVRNGDFKAQSAAIQEFRQIATAGRPQYSNDMGNALHRILWLGENEIPIFGQQFERVIEALGSG